MTEPGPYTPEISQLHDFLIEHCTMPGVAWGVAPDNTLVASLPEITEDSALITITGHEDLQRYYDLVQTAGALALDCNTPGVAEGCKFNPVPINVDTLVSTTDGHLLAFLGIDTTAIKRAF